MVQRLTAFPTRADRWVAGVSALAAGAVCAIVWVIELTVPSMAHFLFAAPLTLLLFLPTLSVIASGNAITDEGLWLKQGFYFKALIPWSEIAEAQALAVPIRSWSAGVQIRDDQLYVKMSGGNLVRVDLKQPRRFYLLGRLPLPIARQVIFNAPSPAETAALISKLAHLTS